MVNWAVRWNTVSRPACSAMTGMAWMAEAPVPMTATRWPVRPTGSRGQFPVCSIRPRKPASPGKAGWLTADRQPTALIRYVALASVPSDLHGSDAYRRRVGAAMVDRALAAAIREAREEAS